ncbi:MAG: alkaline phosphatase D family protein [Halioglobus sp.]
MAFTRRELLSALSASTFMVHALPLRAVSLTVPEAAPPVHFPQGVASGDPRPGSIMLWTRAEPTPDAAVTGEAIPLLLQLSETESFERIVAEHLLGAQADTDYTIRAFIDGLRAGTSYYYRFLGGQNAVSRTGRTRTAPAQDTSEDVNLAFVSCQSFEQGYYGSWARMIADDIESESGDQIDFVLHLGDFIYERSWHKRQDGTPQSRYVPDFPDGAHNEINRHAVSLADYRHLYKTYLSDPHLQAARARWPFVCTWDDHEFSDDNFQSYSTYSDQPQLEAQRKMDSNQAWFEFMPAVLEGSSDTHKQDFQAAQLSSEDATANQQALESLSIYRRLHWGQNLDLILTDNRSYRSAPCIPKHFAESIDLPMNTVTLVEMADAGRAYNGGNPPECLPYGDGTTPNFARDREPGSCLGKVQRDWFLQTLDSSKAHWKLWGNSLPMLPLRIDMSSIPFSDYQDSVFNIDPWAGFPHEVSTLMDAVSERSITGLVSLSGDHHTHGAATINRSASEPDSPARTVDFTVAGISSSPLFTNVYHQAKKSSTEFFSLVSADFEGEAVPMWNMTLQQGVMASTAMDRTGVKTLADWIGPNAANPGLSFVDTTANGYGLARFTDTTLEVSLVAMSDLTKPFTTAPAIKYTARFSLPLWLANEPPILEGPTFDGPAPFPYTASQV